MAAASFTVTNDIQRLGNNLAQLSERLADTCVKNALNRCADMVKTEAGRQIRQTYNIKQAALNKQMTARYATPSNLSAIVVTMGNAFPLIGFTGTRQNSSGVMVKIRNDRSGKTIAHAFIATTPDSGHKAVWVRTGVFKTMTKGRYQGKVREVIDEKFSLSLPQMFMSKKILAASEAVITANFGPRLEHEIGYQLSVQAGSV